LSPKRVAVDEKMFWWGENKTLENVMATTLENVMGTTLEKKGGFHFH